MNKHLNANVATISNNECHECYKKYRYGGILWMTFSIISLALSLAGFFLFLLARPPKFYKLSAYFSGASLFSGFIAILLWFTVKKRDKAESYYGYTMCDDIGVLRFALHLRIFAC